MSTILNADDLATGMFVAVHSPSPQNRLRFRPSDVEESAIELIERPPSPVPPGVPMRILGISLPFLACAVLKPGGGLDGPVIVDVRAVRLSRLSSGYIAAISNFEPTAEQPAPAEEESPQSDHLSPNRSDG